MGAPYAWAAPIFELPWFGELPGWPYGGQMGYPMGTYPGGGMAYQPGMMNGGMMHGGMMGGGVVNTNGSYVVQQVPGHSVVIQSGLGGAAPTITQVPGSVSSVP